MIVSHYLNIARLVPKRLLFTATRNKFSLRQLSSSSRWEYPELPWSRDERETEAQFKQRKLREKSRKDLERALEVALRFYLQQQYPDAFQLGSQTLGKKSIESKGDTQDTVPARLRTLAKLNGFEEVLAPSPNASLALAEGVLARPNYYNYLSRSATPQHVLMAQPLDEYSYPPLPKKSPRKTIIPEDDKLYRIIENQADSLLTYFLNSIQSFVRMIRNPMESWTRQADTHEIPGGLTEATDSSSRLPIDPTSPSALRRENLLVIGSDRQLVLYLDLDESVRLLVLPHTLGHKAASTLVSVSLVVFGAIPLAYRSLNFALEYPGLSELIAASLVGTVSYGIWSSRYMARTSESNIVSKALMERVYAREGAVLLTLQEGAVHRLTKAVLALYDFYQPHSGGDMPKVPIMACDPLLAAKELRLLRPRPTDRTEEQKQWVAIPSDEATAQLMERKRS